MEKSRGARRPMHADSGIYGSWYVARVILRWQPSGRISRPLEGEGIKANFAKLRIAVIKVVRVIFYIERTAVRNSIKTKIPAEKIRG